MTRVCLIGNSHLAAIKQAVDDGFSLPDMSVRFFGTVSEQFADCEIADGVVRPGGDRARDDFQTTSGGQAEIVASDYDAFWVFMGKSPFFLPHYFPDTTFGLVSDGLVQDICQSWAKGPLVAFAIRLARAFPDMTVRFAGQPFTSADAGWAKAFLHTVPEDAAGRFEVMNATIAQELHALLPPNMQVVRPPETCLEPHGLFTRDEMCRGSRRLIYGGGHKGTDYSHMNGQYGQAVLEKLHAMA